MDAAVEKLYTFAMVSERIGETAGPPPGVLVSGHFDERPGYRAFRAHGRADWLVKYTLRGEGLYRQPGLSLLARPGDLTLLAPGAYQDYSVPVDGGWEFLWAHFVPRPTWTALLTLPEVGRGLHLLSLVSPPARERVEAAFRRLHRDSLGRLHPLAEELVLNALEEVLLVAAGEAAEAGRSPFDPRVQHVLDLLARDLVDEHSVERLAAAVYLSPSRLAHLFKEQTGETITEALRQLRLGQAARLLRHSGRSVQEIAAEVGFHCPFHFSRRFRRAFGVGPREYRRQAQARGVLEPDSN
jgi:AraC family transcriptional regulator, arabinose operon regulatory protein